MQFCRKHTYFSCLCLLLVVLGVKPRRSRVAMTGCIDFVFLRKEPRKLELALIEPLHGPRTGRCARNANRHL